MIVPVSMRVLSFQVLLFFSLFIYGQEKQKIQLKSAAVLEYNKPVNPDFQILKGNVVFQHNESFLYCDSAFLYIHRNAMDAFGDVHIKVSDTTQIYGERLRYDGDKSIAVMENKVQLIDNNVVLKTDKLTYDLANGVGYYLNGAEIQDPSNKLVSRHGYYYSGKKEFFFRHDVKVTGNNFTMTSDSLMYNTMTEKLYFYGNSHLVSDSTHIYCQQGWYNTISDQTELYGGARMTSGSSVLCGDTLFYDRKSGVGSARRNVVFRDTTERIMLLGRQAYYRSADSSVLATDSAMFITWDEADTLFLHADTLFSRKDTLTGREMKAYHQVRFFRKDLQGICDSLYYCEKDSLMRMYMAPCLWSDSTQMTADYIEFSIDRSEIRELFMKGNAFIISGYRDGDFQQVKGNLMNGYFIKNELDRMIVKGNAESIYFIEDENGARTGINKSTSAQLNLYFVDGEVSFIGMQGSPEGTIFPDHELSSEQRKLAGFIWRSHLRPAGKHDLIKDSIPGQENKVIRSNTEN